ARQAHLRASGTSGAAASPSPAVRALWLDGRWAEARAQAERLVAHQVRGERLLARVLLGALARARGERELAWSCVREPLPAGAAAEPGDLPLLLGLDLQRLAAGLAVDTGDLPT